jgi:ureidoacrylate peracid hydrolase
MVHDAQIEADGLAAWIAPTRAALAIIDMQADFVLPDGALGRSGANLAAVGPALVQAQGLADAARRAGAQVVFVGLQTSPDRDSAAWTQRLRRRGLDPARELDLCRVGTPGAAFVGPRPVAGDLVVAKLRYSAFSGTVLDSELRARGIDTIVVCGLTTECCVDCTVRDAFHLDYHVFVVSDACAAYDAALHEAALRSLDLHSAIVVDAADVASAWQGRGENVG